MQENAKLVLALAELLGVKGAEKSLAEYSGSWRRMEVKGETPEGVLIMDDYGHHPTEIAATLQGTRELFPLSSKGGSASGGNKGGVFGGLSPKIVVVFQPHLYSRTKQHLEGFGAAFKEASSVILLPIYPAREKDPGDINSQMVVDEIKKRGKDAHLVQTFDESAKLAELKEHL